MGTNYIHIIRDGIQQWYFEFLSICMVSARHMVSVSARLVIKYTLVHAVLERVWHCPFTSQPHTESPPAGIISTKDVDYR